MFRTEQHEAHPDPHRRRERITAEIRAGMGRKNINAATLSAKTGISAAALSRKLNNKAGLTVDELFDICDGIEVSAGELLLAATEAP